MHLEVQARFRPAREFLTEAREGRQYNADQRECSVGVKLERLTDFPRDLTLV